MAAVLQFETKLKDARDQLKEYNKQYEKSGNDLKALQSVGQTLDRAKVLLTQMEFLPLNVEDPKVAAILSLTRDILEIGAFYSLEKTDLASFDRYIAQLKCYYFDYGTLLGNSASKYELFGLHLLRLLALSNVSDFHVELELLPFEEIQNNPFIRYPVSLEQNLMEGSYNKIFAAKDVPSKHYRFFVDKLMETIRKEIALAIQKSYKCISEKEAARLLFVNEKGLHEFVNAQMGWTQNGKREFTFNLDPPEASEKRLPAGQIAFQMLAYAREMEKIV